MLTCCIKKVYIQVVGIRKLQLYQKKHMLVTLKKIMHRLLELDYASFCQILLVRFTIDYFIVSKFALLCRTRNLM